jgi:hypothetical protein
MVPAFRACVDRRTLAEFAMHLGMADAMRRQGGTSMRRTFWTVRSFLLGLLLVLPACDANSGDGTAPAPGTSSTSKSAANYPADNTEAVRIHIKAKRDLAQSEFERLNQQFTRSFQQRGEHPTCDGLLADVRALKSDTDIAVKRVTSQLDDLTGFLKQNDDYAPKLDFAGVRTWIDQTRQHATGLGERVSKAASGVRDERVLIKAASGDWDATGVTTALGDLLAFEASGQWTIGNWVGSCGPGGMTGHQNYSLQPDHPLGCLLVRAGETAVAAGNQSGIFPISGSGGAVAMRCNDKNCADNSGSLSVRVVLVPMSIIAAR